LEIKNILAIIGLVVSTFTLFIKLLLPATLQVIIEGQQVEIRQIPNIYLPSDVAVIGASCFVLGASLIYLLFPYRTIVTRVEGGQTFAVERWRKTLEGLTNEDERKVYQLIIEANGIIFQGQLVEKSGFPKGKVSLVLDRLEARGLLERKRHGMSNVVVLK
jgi:uncharacterized membrane protein